jgi:hypothetical protein
MRIDAERTVVDGIGAASTTSTRRSYGSQSEEYGQACAAATRC